MLQAGDGDGTYLPTISEREASKQEVAANALAERLTREDPGLSSAA